MKEKGKLYGFGPVVREVVHMLQVFDQITWIGFKRNDWKDNPILMEFNDSRINVILLPKSGGNSFFKKLQVLFYAPQMFFIILREVLMHQLVHTRAPSSPAFIGILISFFLRSKKWWHKYAGNWAQENPPPFYGLQRALLKWAAHTKVTINGRWPDGLTHCISFENPCLSQEERVLGRNRLEQKTYQKPLKACFIGRLESEKGVGRILDALETENGQLVSEMHFFGDGPERNRFEQRAKALNSFTNIQFHGFVSRNELGGFLGKSDLLFIPSTASEGFPKVIAEAWNYGCVPLVSDVSAIPYYLNNENGYLWERKKIDFKDYFSKIDLNPELLQKKAEEGYSVAEKFTFNNFNNRLVEEVFS